MTELHRKQISGLPDSLLADCLLNMGKRGGGKSYTFRIAMERALTKRVRCGWIDAMGVGWGITVAGDGGPGFPVVVFGGDHGQVALSENAGAALGALLAKASFSWVLDLKAFKSKASRVRFMADFVEAIYENCDEPLLLFLDEVDLWAPQMILDKQGPSAKLLGAMHELVRRGRVKGLSIWMATQRPAEVSKGIISQADALLTFKLMAPQDLDAATDWMKGHVGKTKAAEWVAQIPELKTGEAIVYLTEPHVSIDRVAFPLIQTLDTFRPPKKGETAPSDKNMAKVDLEAINTQLAGIKAEIDANDPKELRKQIIELKKHVAAKPSAVPAADLTHERSVAYNAGWAAAMRDVAKERATSAKAFANIRSLLERAVAGIPVAEVASAMPTAPQAIVRTAPRPAVVTASASLGNLPRPQQRVIDAVAWWAAAGNDAPTRAQVAGVAGYSPGSGGFNNLVGALGSAGLLIVPSAGMLSLTDAGRAEANQPDAPTTEELHERVRNILSAPHVKLFNALTEVHPNALTRDELAERTGYAVGSGGFNNLIGKLSTLEITTKPAPGTVRAADWLFV